MRLFALSRNYRKVKENINIPNTLSQNNDIKSRPTSKTG